MDLRQRLELAGKALLALLDPEAELMPTHGYEAAHDLGRWWDAVLRLEEAIGFAIPAELEAASLRNLHLLTDNPDRLLMNRLDRPWLRDRARINPHNFRETLLAFGGLVRRRQSAWARGAALQLVAGLDRCLQADGSLDLSRLGAWGQVPPTEDPSHTEPRREGWFDATATSGRSLEALVWLHQATGEPQVLELARRIAAHHLAASTSPDGAARPEIVDPENIGHNHSYHGTLRGLLLFGLHTQQEEYVAVVESTYQQAIRHRIVLESGWTPHDLGKTRFSNPLGDPVTDPASTGDVAQLALWLALYQGRHDLFDDVERYLRARLLPAQLTEEDVRRHPERSFKPREIGAWPIHGPTHAGKGCTPDVLAAVVHTLCDLYRHITTPSPAGLRVNLHLNYEDEQVRIRSTRGPRAELRVTTTHPGDLLLRIPGWAPADSVALHLDGVAQPLVLLGAYAWIPGDRLRPGSEVLLTHELPERQTEEIMPSGRRYRFAWRGDEIQGVSPQDGPLPFYPDLPEEDLPPGLSPAQAQVYREARLRGRCHEGALEAALGHR